MFSLFGLSLVSFCLFFSLLLVLASSKSFLILSWGLFGSNLSSQDDPPTLKNLGFTLEISTFLKNKKNNVFNPKMVLRASWGSLGLLLGALGGLLGALLGLQIDRKGLTRSDPFALWALLGISLVSFSCFGVLLLASSWFSFFEIVSYRLLEPLWVDFELQIWHSEPQKP